MSLLGTAEVIRVHVDTGDKLSSTDDDSLCSVQITPIAGANWMRIASASIPLSSGTFQVPKDPDSQITILFTGNSTPTTLYTLDSGTYSNGSSFQYSEAFICTQFTLNLTNAGFSALSVTHATTFGNVSKWVNTHQTHAFRFLTDNDVFGIRAGDVVRPESTFYSTKTMDVSGKNQVQYLCLPSILDNNRVSLSANKNSTQNIGVRVNNDTGRLWGTYANFQNQLTDDWSKLNTNAIGKIDVEVLNRRRQVQSLNRFPVYFVLEFK